LTAVPRPNIVPLPVFYGTEICRAEARRYRSRVVKNAGGDAGAPEVRCQMKFQMR